MSHQTRKTVLLTMLSVVLLSPGILEAKIVTGEAVYKYDEAEYLGYIAFDDSLKYPRPGVLVVHEWWGQNDYARLRTRKLARLGYVAFALDMYGQGRKTEHPEQAKEWSGQLADVALMRERATAGLNVLRHHPMTDPDRLAAIGYCFGGATVLQLAYSGADIRGVVSFHGSLPPATPQDVRALQAAILVCHGADDPLVPPDRVEKFTTSLAKSIVDWELVAYPGAAHSFTNPAADGFGIDGVSYNADADRASWAKMKAFLDQVFDLDAD